MILFNYVSERQLMWGENSSNAVTLQYGHAFQYDHGPVYANDRLFVKKKTATVSVNKVTPKIRKKKNPKKWNCVQCGKSYRSKDSLVAHVKLACGKDAAQACEFCDYRTRWPSNLRVHKMRHHQRY